MSTKITRACISREEIMDFYTLQDFLNFTKGSAYVLMLVVVVCFIPFWLFLTDREQK